METIFAFIKIGKKWHCIPIESEWDFQEKMEDNLQHHITNGNVVAFADDVETFIYAMGIMAGDVVMVDDAEDDEG